MFELTPRPAHLPQRDQLGEGPFWDGATQALWWVDIVGRRVQRLDGERGEVRVWRAPGHVSAAVPCAGGGLMLALPDGLHRMNLGSGLTTPWASPDPDAANRSNECRADPQGRLWLGTMGNNLAEDGAPRPLGEDSGGLFRIDRDGRAARLLEGIGIANTLAWSPQGDRFYFADSRAGVIWRFPFDMATGEIGEREVFADRGAAPGGPDGSAVDEEGRLWNARWGGSCVAVFAPDGRLERTLPLPVRQPSSVAFGGGDLRTLYVTSARQELDDLAPDDLDGGLFSTRVETPGLPMARFAG